MPENENQNIENENENQKGEVTNFIEAARDVKKNYVPKAELDEAKKTINELTAFILEGKELPDQPKKEKQEKKLSIAELKKKLRGEQTNLDYAITALALRDAIMEKGGRDPFIPNNPKGYEDSIYAQNFADKLETLIDRAKGDPDEFNHLLDKAMPKDDAATIARLRAAGYKI